MKFQHNETQDDGGGKLTITAETQAEILEVLTHFRIFDKSTPEGMLQLASALNSPLPYVVEIPEEKRKWYVVEQSLDVEFSRVYWERLRQMTGFSGDLGFPPDMDLTPFHPKRLCHTHITNRVWLSGGHICFEVFQQSQEWNKKTAVEYAEDTATDYVAEDFGFRKHEREYIQKGSIMVRNPNYLKRHKAQPGIGAPWFWKVLWQWWLANRASEAQKAILNACRELKHGWTSGEDWEMRQGGGEQCTLVSYSLYYADANGTCDWDGKGRKASVMKWDEFAKLAS